MELKHKVTEEQAGKRLDLLLTLIQNEISRSAVKRQLNDGVVRVNGEVEYRPNYKAKLGDEIEANFKFEEPINEVKGENIPLDIVYEDEHLLAINKPSGMVVHPATGNWSGTLMNAIIYHYQDQKQVGDNIRSGLIHRLDKDTSGLVLIGKTNKGLWHYSKQFAGRKVKKTYKAMVRGDVRKTFGKTEAILENYIGRSHGDRKKFAVVDPEKGKIAKTKVVFTDLIQIENNEYSLVNVFPTTGRTHQIRVHMNTLGHPVMGDVIYGRNNAYDRLMLHAWKLEITNVEGELLKLQTKLPTEFLKLV